MAAQHRAVGEHDVVLDDAIVRHVRCDHEQAAVADPRHVAGLQGPVHGAILAEHVAVADLGRARVLGHVDVLRHAAQHGAFQDQVVAAQNRSRLHRHAAGQVTAVAQHDAGFHNAERPDSHVGSKLGMRTDDSKRVNRHEAGPFRDGGMGTCRSMRESPWRQRDSRIGCAGYGSPPAASYAFITIGRNNCAGLAGGGDFSAVQRGAYGRRRGCRVTLEEYEQLATRDVASTIHACTEK